MNVGNWKCVLAQVAVVVACASGALFGTPAAHAQAQAPLPPGVVAYVAEAASGLGVVTISELHRGIAQLRAEKGVRGQVPGGERRKIEAAKALERILASIDVRSEAAERGISIPKAELLHRYKADVRKAFATRSDYRRYLRHRKLSVADAVGRVRDRMLGTKILASVTRTVAGDKSAEQAALQDFAREYRSKWSSRTICAPEYVIAQCADV